MPEGVGYDIPNTAPQPETQETQRQEASAQQQWFQKLTDFSADPVNSLMLMQIGSALAAGPAYGQTHTHQIINALGEGVGFKGRAAQRTLERQERERKEDREAEQVLAQGERDQQRIDLEEQRLGVQQARDAAAQRMASRKEARMAGREPATMRKLDAEARYFEALARSGGKTTAKAKQITQLATALHQEHPDKYPTYNAAYIEASRLEGKFKDWDSRVWDYVVENAPFEDEAEIVKKAQRLADEVEAGRARDPGPPPKTKVPEHIANMGSLWKELPNKPKELDEAARLYGVSDVMKLINHYRGQ